MLKYEQRPLIYMDGELVFLTSTMLTDILNEFEAFNCNGWICDCIINENGDILKYWKTDAKVAARWIFSDFYECETKHTKGEKFFNTLRLDSINNMKEQRDQSVWYDRMDSGSPKGYWIETDNNVVMCRRAKSKIKQEQAVLSNPQCKQYLIEMKSIMENLD